MGILSLNHNGVSFFQVRIPRGVQLHHGTWRPDRVKMGMEWLVFEPEHALNFAFKLCDENGTSTAHATSSMSPRWWLKQENMSDVRILGINQAILSALCEQTPLPPICLEPGWLHTYAPVRDLQLLYIDGTSAGNSNRGTTVSQDYVLLWTRTVYTDPHNPYDPADDIHRTRALCALAEEDFEGKIDGFIRMEHGFEVILCDFSLLKVVNILRSTRNPENPGPMGREPLDEFDFLRATTSRYAGIGGHRVHLDTDIFVTAFTHPEIDMWYIGSDQPQLYTIENATASAILGEVKQMILTDRRGADDRVDWRSIADMYVDRYARPIQNLLSSDFDDAEEVRKEILRLFQPYLNYTSAETDWDGTIKRCQEAFISFHLIDNPTPSLGQRAIEHGAHNLCSFLRAVLADQGGLQEHKTQLRLLMDTLKWTAWKDCQPGCGLDEICFTAIWPFGLKEDHDRPSCLNATEIRSRFGYWDD